MHKSELTQRLIEHLTEKHLQLTESVIKESVDALLYLIITTLSQGGQMEIRGFGSFRLQAIAARNARNPKTGNTVKMSERHRLHFKAGKKLKLRLNAPYR